MTEVIGGRSLYCRAPRTDGDTASMIRQDISVALLSCLSLASILPCQAIGSERYDAAAYRLQISRPDAFVLAPSASPPDVSGQRETAAGAAEFTPIPARLDERPYASLIAAAAAEAGIDPVLVHAVIHVESRYNPKARSPKGALGLMQVMPDTGLRYGISDPASSIEANLRAGTRYLRDLMAMFSGQLELVLAAYNSGENTVIRSGYRIPRIRETQEYVPMVLEKYKEWRIETPVRIGTNSHAEVREDLRHGRYLPGTRLQPGFLLSPVSSAESRPLAR